MTHGSGTQRRRWLSLVLDTGCDQDPKDLVLDRTESRFTTGYIQRREKAHLPSRWVFGHLNLGEFNESTNQRVRIHCSFTLQHLILLCGAASHVEFLIAGRIAVLMTLTIAARSGYTSGPLTQPFLVCQACKASVAQFQGQRAMFTSAFCKGL